MRLPILFLPTHGANMHMALARVGMGFLAALAATTALGPGSPGHSGPAGLRAASAPAAAAAPRLERHYTLPALRLQRADGATLALKDALFDGRPVVLSFMFSSCTTVCPITNQTLVAFEGLLGADARKVNVVSISIDPDHDSVGRLARYAKETGAKGNFFTSDPATSEAVQRAFEAWRGDKMNHQPVFLLNTRSDRKWLRLEGLVTPGQLVSEYKNLIAQGL
jgi:protein SCO1